MEKIIQVKNLCVNYGNNIVLNNISFDVNKGEFCTIIGPNGTGKSTTIKAIMKNIDVSSGEIFINKKNINQLSYRDKARLVGFVPQEYNLHYDFSVYDIVAMGRNPYLKKFGKSGYDDKKIICDALKKTGTYDLKDKGFTKLSGGEKQRVIIARALAQQPTILILDEATSNLDMHHQLDVLELIYSLNREDGLTVLAIMHDLNMASRFSDKLILLDKDGIVKKGTKEEVIDEEVLSQVYNMEMVVRDNKLLNCREVIPLRSKKIKDKKSFNVHVICGGGTGEYILQKLYSENYCISCGVINQGDSDFELCNNLNLCCIYEKPFTTFSKKVIDENRKLVEKSDVIILTDVAIGNGNLPNIEILRDFKDKKIIVLYNSNRDFTGGKCKKVMDEIIKNNNVFVAMNLKEIFKKMSEYYGENNDISC